MPVYKLCIRNEYSSYRKATENEAFRIECTKSRSEKRIEEDWHCPK